jgi:L-threonylcarbamoyladenylate synthase
MALLELTDANIGLCAARLRDGELVAFPTETVYGLGADATNDRAVAAIFAAKGRPEINPVIVHYLDARGAAADVEMTPDGALLASLFWPGPLTLILPRKRDCRLSRLVSAGLPSQGVRVPDHPVARKLLQAAGVPVAAPSANASGRMSPTTPQHVLQSLGDRAGLILAAGKARVGLESTVVDVTGETPVLLRPGAVTLEDLEQALGKKVDVSIEATGDAPKSPGQLLKHYAPRTPLRLRAVDVAPGEGLLAFGHLKFMGLRGGGFARDLPLHQRPNLSETGDLTEAAANLFSMLHQLDGQGLSSIAVMDVPNVGLGMAINDRLKRAAGAQNL